MGDEAFRQLSETDPEAEALILKVNPFFDLGRKFLPRSGNGEMKIRKNLVTHLEVFLKLRGF